jgi:predicted CoA-binding protein
LEPRDNIVDDDARIGELLRSTRRVAVLGMKTERQADRPAFYVPEYLMRAGAEVIPVPVYYPEVTHLLGKQVYRKITDVPPPVDLVDVFRRAQDIGRHVEDLKRARPRIVWFQSGIRNDEAALELAAEGILVVQDRCLMVEWRRHVAR